jgi:hypothetical protein
MGFAMEDAFMALNAADWQTGKPKTPPSSKVNRRLQLRAQVQELVNMYSLNHLLGGHIQDDKLLDTYCLAIKQLLGLQGCWIVNGTVVMGSSQVRSQHPDLLATLNERHQTILPPDHSVWKALKQTGLAFGYATPCHLFRQTGGLLLLRSQKPLTWELVNRFAQVVSANVQLQHQLWQINDDLELASESALQVYRTELTEWILTLLEHQTALVNSLSQFVSQRNGLTSNHPLRVASLCRQMGEHLGWDDDLIDAVAQAGFQTTLEGIQWNPTLQDGRRTWEADDRNRAKAQEGVGWLMLSQFFPLIEWPAQSWSPQCHPARLLGMVREYCAMTETRHYRRVSKSARKHAQALERLTVKGYPASWLASLQQLAQQMPT